MSCIEQADTERGEPRVQLRFNGRIFDVLNEREILKVSPGAAGRQDITYGDLTYILFFCDSYRGYNLIFADPFLALVKECFPNSKQAEAVLEALPIVLSDYYQNRSKLSDDAGLSDLRYPYILHDLRKAGGLRDLEIGVHIDIEKPGWFDRQGRNLFERVFSRREKVWVDRSKDARIALHVAAW